MKVLTVSDFRRNMAEVLNSVVEDAEEVVIPRDGRKAVVIVSLDEWDAMRETLHVLGTPENARILLDRMADMEAGRGEQHDLLELDDEPGEATTSASAA